MSDLEAFAGLVPWTTGSSWSRPLGPTARSRSSTPECSNIPGPGRPVVVLRGGRGSRYWHEYDCVMAAERRVAVLVTPERTYGNG